MQFYGITRIFFIFILVAVTWLFLNILSSYFSSILWAAILAVIFYPVKHKLQKILDNRNNLASLFTISIICLIVFIPLTIIISLLATELNVIYTTLRYNNTYLLEVVEKLLKCLPEWVSSFLEEQGINSFPLIQQKFAKEVLKSGQYLAGSAFLIGKGTFGFAINFIVMLYLLFFLLKEGQCLIHQILNFLPLSEFVKKHLFIKFATVARAIVKGTIVIAIIQGTLGGIAFYIVDIGSSVLWGSLMTFLSLVPAFGSAVIWIPASIYLFVKQQVWQGIFIVSFFLIIIGFVDNFLKPVLVGKDAKIPDYLVLITTLGGIDRYGINGFVIGPLVAALFIACWNLLSRCTYESNDNDRRKALIKKSKS